MNKSVEVLGVKLCEGEYAYFQIDIGGSGQQKHVIERCYIHDIELGLEDNVRRIKFNLQGEMENPPFNPHWTSSVWVEGASYMGTWRTA